MHFIKIKIKAFLVLQHKIKHTCKTYDISCGILHKQTITDSDNRQHTKLGEAYIDLIYAAPLKYKIYNL